MNNRKIEKKLSPNGFKWVGDAFYTASFIGMDTGISHERMSPFFAIGYNPDYKFEPREIPRGVGGHPHKGFETVTVAYKGKIAHRDSAGNSGVIGEGDVQWMTAGAGIMHEEYHEQEFSRKGGLFQMVQLWVNLPAKDKETKPKYQDLLYDKMTRVNIDEKSFVNVITGEYKGQKGKGTTFSPIHLYNAYLNKSVKTEFDFPNDYNTAILVIDGEITVNGEQELKTDMFAMFENGKDTKFSIEATQDKTIVLVMSGKPLNEPIAHYGPFVMNTQEQLQKAFEEFRSGKFGKL